MKAYLLSLGVGLLVGVIYSLSGVRSPAPPAIALLGLLGMLLGEQALPLARRLAQPPPAASAPAERQAPASGVAAGHEVQAREDRQGQR
ncbi:XapX domain-containing protein [Pseudomonas sp. RW407]|uniref:DUF1427 family protein n=1 Tax=Pseudomonas sp. RW407 TaxID=2202894 RepID=UPI000D6F12D6|nr:DUF1427 family protein [Pseudomonas sp. RW407]PWU29942.1 XapX domain-containing protein [Pseudomonas sp. RW407]